MQSLKVKIFQLQLFMTLVQSMSNAKSLLMTLVQFMSNAKIFIDKMFTVKNSGMQCLPLFGLEIQLDPSKNEIEFCSQLGSKWYAMFELLHESPCRDLHWQDWLHFWFEDFFSNLPWKIIIYFATDHPLVGQVLTSHFSVLLEEHSAKNVLSEYISSHSYVQWDDWPRLGSNELIKCLQSIIFVHSVWPWYSSWACSMYTNPGSKNSVQN